ncbi:hypothetical protein F5878DRAFT_208722 [Lentinula raphanica]|uniref:Uncharacterized protein n=1 Tax=Lentinula raphanica TaxID=153919 RepID=A0AA38P7J5_9AGAR|nr:hypothetical protein EV360DRAFT_50461 [Lentinula raphanica]KAJ3837611.1 hypothetical protein F5878DRAFT_208722 [Lentinula raphanica]
MFSSVRSVFVSMAVVVASASFIGATPVHISARSSVTTLANNFTLAALNNTLPNANSTGAPLVLGSDGAIDGESFHVSSTYASYPYNDFPSLGLVGGNLRAYFPDGSWSTNATALTGYALSWGTSTYYSSPASTAFSAVSDGSSEYPILAVNDVTDLWYLCPSDAPRVPQNTLYFNTTTIPSQSGVSGASPVECYSVTVNMVPV